MRFVCVFAFILTSALHAFAQVYSEPFRLKANLSRYINLNYDSSTICLAHIQADGSLDEIIDPNSQNHSEIDTNFLKGNLYAGHCVYQGEHHIFYYKNVKKDSFILCGASGNITKHLARFADGLTTLHCERKQLPEKILTVADAREIYVCVPAYASDEKNSAMELLVADSSMQILRAKKLTLPYGDNTLEILQILPDTAGNIYVLSKQKTLGGLTQFASRHFLFYYNFRRNALKEYDLQIQGKNITGAYLEATHNGDITICGFYSDDKSMESSGVFHSRITSPGGTISALRIQPFLASGMSAFTEKNPGKILVPNLELDGIYSYDGGISLWGERRYSTEHSGIDPLTGRIYSEIRHHSDQIIIAHIDTSGQLVYNKTIDKQQTSAGETLYLSYHWYTHGDTMCFAFNDHPANQRTTGAPPYNWSSSKSSSTAIARIYEEGQIKYDLYPVEGSMRLVPHLCAGNHILYGEGKKIRLCRYPSQ
jgi:hypothetical protein